MKSLIKKTYRTLYDHLQSTSAKDRITAIRYLQKRAWWFILNKLPKIDYGIPHENQAIPLQTHTNTPLTRMLVPHPPNQEIPPPHLPASNPNPLPPPRLPHPPLRARRPLDHLLGARGTSRLQRTGRGERNAHEPVCAGGALPSGVGDEWDVGGL
jgi:hypothetical protein